ncbi:hypothetical protein LCGC14_2032690, partial [marine sediment metagenome]
MRPAQVRSKLARILPRLRKHYGPRKWRPGAPAVEQLVGTILSQNTTGANVAKGMR